METLLEKARKVNRKKIRKTREYSEQDLELVEAWLSGSLSAIQVSKAVTPPNEKRVSYLAYIGSVMRHFYQQGKVKIIK